jgi:anthranilate synthase component 2
LKVLIIDNYDSFVYNLAQYVGGLGAEPLVYRSSQITLRRAVRLNPDRIIISPGPGDPSQSRYFGICPQIIRHLSPKIPTLGVCLGHQGIVWVFGGRIVKANRIMHGKTSPIWHDGRGIFKSIENPLQAVRYHSLVAEKASLPKCLTVTAFSLDDGEIMGVRHVEYPIEGVQFHPESILTYCGKQIIKNFLDGG